MFRWNRTASLIISLFGAFTNLVFALQLFAVWSSFKWEAESEWEGSVDSWTVNGAKVVGGLAAAYFLAAAVASAAGFIGIVKGIPKYVRFYRDYSIADFTFCTFTTLFVTYASCRYYSVRTAICEEFSRHADLMRDLAEMGLNLENCEQWFERAVVAFVVVMFIVIVIRLHFVLALSSYHRQLLRQSGRLPLFVNSRNHKDMQRVYLLPSPTSATPPTGFSCQEELGGLVYAPVPLRDLTERDARELNAREAWVRAEGRPPHRHSHSHSHSHSHRHHGTGRIGLPIRPDEGLLAGHEKFKD
ncbi:hypothetical protein EWM64_g10153 [Hericium alpestre]|uniref:Uncharacterized protein n=1 Tax=Hericium alpestre TaxID=135208 RepID=A0A4Y9ZK97_9AGAM|nr:hypothetical protein EWM64_g10153 [Hericium alpestre]